MNNELTTYEIIVFFSKELILAQEGKNIEHDNESANFISSSTDNKELLTYETPQNNEDAKNITEDPPNTRNNSGAAQHSPESMQHIIKGNNSDNSLAVHAITPVETEY